MSYMSVSDLKRTKALGEKLAASGELVITRDGKPMAIMIGVEPDDLESSLREIRRALFSAAVTRIRARDLEQPASESELRTVVAAARRDRRI